jgi:hypothetical protein
MVSFTVNDADGVTSSLIKKAEIVDAVHPRSIGDARLFIEAGTTVTATRDTKGPLGLDFAAHQDVGIASRMLLKDGSEIRLSSGSGVRIYLNEMDSKFMLAFNGSVEIGAVPGPRVDAMLLSAKITILEKQPLFKGRFVLDQREIEPGSFLKLFGRIPKQKTLPHDSVLIRVDTDHLQERDKDAIQIFATSGADEVNIIRFGSSDYLVKPSPWSRIRTDPLAQWLLVTLVVLASFATLLGLFEQTWDSRRSKRLAQDIYTE